MSTVDHLLDAYRTAFRAGTAVDPAPYLAQVEGDERRLLAAYIESFLAAEPGRPFDTAAFAAFSHGPMAARVRAATGETWATLLPAARSARRIKRSTLTRRLADALGVGDRVERVAAYYHRMETGALPGDGVSDRVLDALADIVGVSRERLRAAGAGRPPAWGAEQAVFARSAPVAPAAAAAAAPAPAPPCDEVDELFTGGA